MRSLPIIPFLLAVLSTAPAFSIEPARPAPIGVQHWECVPVARALSGIQIRGDAHTWWGQAEGRYSRGHRPKRGAVLAFKPAGAMSLGHVAAVSQVVNDRTLLVTHSNWSLIDGRRGQIERDVRVVDVSEDNDWSRVRVWYAPLGDLGTTAWPTHGFIYPDSPAPMRLPQGAVIANGPSPAKITRVFPSEMKSPNGSGNAEIRGERELLRFDQKRNYSKPVAQIAARPALKSPALPKQLIPADRFMVETNDEEPKPTGNLAYLERRLARYR